VYRFARGQAAGGTSIRARRTHDGADVAPSAPRVQRRPARTAVLWLAVLLAWFGSATAALVQAATEYSADAVKAAFLYRFTSYVAWPAEPSSSAPLEIAVLGAPSVAEALAHLLPEQRVDGRPLQLRAIDDVSQLGNAQVLYVGAGPSERLRAIVRALDSRPVLLVGDQEDALRAGAVLNFVLVDRRVRFEVSLTAAARTGLVIRAPLLSVAHRVEGVARVDGNGSGS
jgi:hypothetical protein